MKVVEEIPIDTIYRHFIKMPSSNYSNSPSSSSLSCAKSVVKLTMQPSSSPSTTGSNGSGSFSTSSTYRDQLKIFDKEFEQRQNDNTRSDSHSSLSLSSAFDSSEESTSSLSILHNQEKGQKTLKMLMVHAMLKQESTTYKCEDYFNSSQRKTILIHPKKESDCGYDNHDHFSPKSASSVVTGTTASSTINESSTESQSKCRQLVDLTCRSKICEWTYRIINFFSIDREAAYYSLSYADRFLLHYRVDRFTYKLLATTCLFLALKVHQPRKLILKNVVKDLSKGDFDMEDVNRMELIVLRTLLWSLNPPTPLSFVKRLFDLHRNMIAILSESLACSNLHESLQVVIDVETLQSYSIFFVELSLFDYYFVTKRQSRIALASVLNSIEGLGLFNAVTMVSTNHCKTVLYKIVMSMYTLIKFDLDSCACREEMTTMREKLWELYESSEESENVKNGSFFGRRSSVESVKGSKDKKKYAHKSNEMISSSTILNDSDATDRDSGEV